MDNMTQEDKKLLLQDLCARLPYGVYCKGITKCYDDEYIEKEVTGVLVELHHYKCIYGLVGLMNECDIETIKPYLRPMSSITEEEKKELERLIDEKLNGNIEQEDDDWTPWVLYDTTGIKNYVGGERFYFDEMSFIYNWLNAHHFDYRNLIEKGLALEAHEGMYNLNK